MRTEKSKTVCILLAVFFSFFSWLYTFKHDSKKFWTALIAVCIVYPGGLILTVFTLGLGGLLVIPLMIFVGPGIWIWAIIDAVQKDEKMLRNY